MTSWKGFLFFTLLCIFLQGFFSMFEMACVSFNRVRLSHYVKKKNKRAKWIQYLLNRPSTLFGTTLICVNTFLQMGSEFSRKLYDSFGLNPDLAPITQIVLVVIFAELAPMFAARRHSEQVAMLYIPVVYFVSYLLRPFIFLIESLNKIIHKMLPQKKESSLFLSREEVQKAFEDNVEETSYLDRTLSYFFTMKDQKAEDFMYPLQNQLLVSSETKAKDLIEKLKSRYTPFIPIYQYEKGNIKAIVSLRDLLKADPEEPVGKIGKTPWFVTKKDSITGVLKQFRKNNQSIAIVLDEEGKAFALLSLEKVVEALFGKTEALFIHEKTPKTHIERTLSASMTIKEFNQRFQANIEAKEGDTLSDFIHESLGHIPVKGEKVREGFFEFEVVKVGLLGAKKILVVTKNL